jgi:hypothetical protein
VAAVVTPSERADILQRLLVMMQTLRTVANLAEANGKIAREAGAEGLALATFMLGESIQVFSKELARFTTGFLNEEVEK